MLWNDLDYEMQLKVISRFGDIMLEEKDEQVQFAMAAALVELEMWSNSPIPERITKDSVLTIEADPFSEKGNDNDSSH